MLAWHQISMSVRHGWFRNIHFSKTTIRTATLIALHCTMETQVDNPLCDLLFSEDQLRLVPVQTQLEMCPSSGACERLDSQSSEPDIRRRPTDQVEQEGSEEQVPPPVSTSTTEEGCPATKPQAGLAASVRMDAADELLVGAGLELLDADLELHDADAEQKGVGLEDTGVELACDADVDLEDADIDLEDADVELTDGLAADASEADAAAAGPRLGRLRRMGEGPSAVAAGLAPLPALLQQQQPNRVLNNRITVKSSALPDGDEEDCGGGNGGDPLKTAADGGREFTERMAAEGEDGGDEDAADGNGGGDEEEEEEEEEGEYWDEEDEYMEQLLQDDDKGEQVIGNCTWVQG